MNPSRFRGNNSPSRTIQLGPLFCRIDTLLIVYFNHFSTSKQTSTKYMYFIGNSHESQSYISPVEEVLKTTNQSIIHCKFKHVHFQRLATVLRYKATVTQDINARRKLPDPDTNRIARCQLLSNRYYHGKKKSGKW